MEEFAHYNVFYYGTSNKASEGHKASFCLEDSVCASGHNPRYTCNPRVQAISVNCGDLYGQHLDCQWVDITRLGYGEYLLQVSLNPLRLGMESDYGNNDAFCRIVFDEVYSRIYGWEETLEVGNCWLSGETALFHRSIIGIVLSSNFFFRSLMMELSIASIEVSCLGIV